MYYIKSSFKFFIMFTTNLCSWFKKMLCTWKIQMYHINSTRIVLLCICHYAECTFLAFQTAVGNKWMHPCEEASDDTWCGEEISFICTWARRQYTFVEVGMVRRIGKALTNNPPYLVGGGAIVGYSCWSYIPATCVRIVRWKKDGTLSCN